MLTEGFRLLIIAEGDCDQKDGAREGTRTPTMISRRILNPLRLPFRHPGMFSDSKKRTESSQRLLPKIIGGFDQFGLNAGLRR